MVGRSKEVERRLALFGFAHVIDRLSLGVGVGIVGASICAQDVGVEREICMQMKIAEIRIAQRIRWRTIGC